MLPSPVTRQVALIVISTFLAVVKGDPNAPCYDPRGVLTPGYYPCDPTAYITTCCPQGWTCFSNSLCVVTTQSHAFPNLTVGDVVRGTCTNPHWVNNICGDYCLDDANAQGDMAACGGNRFCCGHDFDAGTCNCSSDGGAFTVNPGRAQTVLGVPGASFTGSPTYVSPTRHQTSSSTVASTQARKTSATTRGSSTGISSRTTAPSATTTSSLHPTTSSSSSSSSSPAPETSSAAPTPTPTPPSSSPGASKALKIGLGVAIPLAALAVGGGIAAWLVRRRRRRQEQEGKDGAGGPTGAWGTTNDDLAENERTESPVLSRSALG